MDQITIRCGSCNNLMAIQTAHLGQQVQCPVCQAVVQTPPPEAPPQQAPDNQFNFDTGAEEGESIFSTVEQTDDIFGSEPPPQVEMPPETPPVPPPEAESPLPGFPSEPVPPVPPQEAIPSEPGVPPTGEVPPPPPSEPPDMELGETLSYPTSQTESGPTREWVPPPPDPAPVTDPTSAPTATYLPPTDEGEAPPSELAFTASPDAAGTTPSEEASETNEAFSVGPQQRHRPDAGWGTPLLILCLASWAILATIAAAWLKYRESHFRPPHPLEVVPDVDGDKPGARKVSSIKGTEMPRVHRALSDHLITPLGQPITLGDLRVTPGNLEWSKVQITSERGGKPLDLDGQALKLHLKLENLSKTLAFVPLDAYYVRRYPIPDDLKGMYDHAQYLPYSYLKVGNRSPFLYGGPAGYSKVGTGRDRDLVVGQKINIELKPGESLETFICTDPTNKHAKRLFANLDKNEELLWRIRLRRGAVEVKGKLKPASAVIGVRFTASQLP